MDTFRKRSFTATSLSLSIANFIHYSPWIIWAYLLRGFSAAFNERLLLVVSGVNDCRYCSWYHGLVAQRHGVSTTEVDQLLQQLVPYAVDEKDVPALMFALHYAQSGGQPLKQFIDELYRHYSPRQVNGILGLCAAIFFGNLCGNTYDAFIARLQGNSSSESSLWIELPVFLVCAPFLLPLMLRVSKSARPNAL